MHSVKLRDILPPNLIQSAEMFDKMRGAYLNQIGALSLATTDIYRTLGMPYMRNIIQQFALAQMNINKFLEAYGAVDIVRNMQSVHDSFSQIIKTQQFAEKLSFLRDISRFAEQIKGMDLVYGSASDAEFNDLEEINVAMEEVCIGIKKATSPQEVIKVLSNWPEKHPILVSIFLWVVFPLLLNITGSALYDRYKEWSSHPLKFDTPKSIVRDVQKMPVDRSTLKSFKFVKVDVLNVREGKSVRSRIVDRLRFGQTVEVLRGTKDWIYVKYYNCDDETLEGWVYKKYTERFK